ncbi:MAG: transcription-repair coupling factor, partial [Bacilli bacterium]
EMSIASPELRAERIEVMKRLVREEKGVYILPVASLRRTIAPKNCWQNYINTYKVGDEVQISQLTSDLVAIGYERVDMVEGPGQFALRGGIIDIYSLTEEHPYRFEFFDTEIDSIRTFSLDTQRSIQNHDSVELVPATEFVLRDIDLQFGLRNLKEMLQIELASIQDKERKTQLEKNIMHDIEALQHHDRSTNVEKYITAFYPEQQSILQYVSKDAVILFDEMVRITETCEQIEREEAEWYVSLLAKGEILQKLTSRPTLPQLLKAITQPKVFTTLFARPIANISPQSIVSTNTKTMQEFFGKFEMLKQELERWCNKGYHTIILSPNEERKKKLQQMLEENRIHVTVGDARTPISPKVITLLVGDLQQGFEYPTLKMAVLTERELFNKKAKSTTKRQKLSNAERLKSHTELRPDDYVVHINHGIGKYIGIETIEVNGIHKDYMHLIYQGNDKLYVPVEQIDQVQKFVSAEGKEPKIYKLGGTEWKKVKRKVERCVQDIADDLIKLYAEREAARGFSCGEDTTEQREFEQLFPYQETEDQLQAIEEIKRDMESIRPMDRLLCGDVGYGKTEVAIRAAFKAIMNGKQVAFLVPTTILAQQHFQTLKERFQDFPIEVGLLSRFRKPKQQKETIEALNKGTIDIVVGTHRLLGKEVKYRDLGLLIIDEEQRFGVTHKEKIKQLKTNVDVLTLTATPIPRTLHMSMIGVRDLSILETPPHNRFPVQTYVMEYEGMVVKDAIERELARNGQVFYLYNRVEDIESKAQEIAMLVPDAKVAFAHGRMSENELESTVLAFIEGQYDILVSTTIIETGVDIPNVNTLVVTQADKMGLSQLYQLRGRVGRSNRVAYAYLTYQKDKVLQEVAEKRLQAMREFTELGSGFKIAMRDLSIRGAGNILGAQQHGFIDSVGFDLYSQMLQEAIDERKGIKSNKENNAEIEVNIDAYLPDYYINDSKQKIEMYKRFKVLSSEEELIELQEDLLDRFGEYPREVGLLLQLVLLRIIGQSIHLASMKQKRSIIEITFNDEFSNVVDGPKLFEILHNVHRQIMPSISGKTVTLQFDTKGLDILHILQLIEKLFRGIATMVNENQSTKA